MPRAPQQPEPTRQPGERQRLEVLLEEVHSKQDLILEGLTGLTERMERLEHRVERLEQTVELLQSAIIANTNDIQGLRRDVRNLTERFEAHLQAHAT